jgi:hypothetical protein
MSRLSCRSAIAPFVVGVVLLAASIVRADQTSSTPQPGAFDTTLETILTDLEKASQQTPQTLQVVPATIGVVEPTLCPVAVT